MRTSWKMVPAATVKQPLPGVPFTLARRDIEYSRQRSEQTTRVARSPFSQRLTELSSQPATTGLSSLLDAEDEEASDADSGMAASRTHVLNGPSGGDTRRLGLGSNCSVAWTSSRSPNTSRLQAAAPPLPLPLGSALIPCTREPGRSTRCCSSTCGPAARAPPAGAGPPASTRRAPPAPASTTGRPPGPRTSSSAVTSPTNAPAAAPAPPAAIAQARRGQGRAPRPPRRAGPALPPLGRPCPPRRRSSQRGRRTSN